MEGMTKIVKTVARLVISFIFLYGLYIVIYGHITPGGGFAGGVFISIAYVLMMLAFSKKVAMRKLSNFAASLCDNLGAFSFFIIGLLGSIFSGYFLYNLINHGTPFRLVSAGTIPLSNLAIGVKVGASLYAIFVALSIYGRVLTEKEEK